MKARTLTTIAIAVALTAIPMASSANQCGEHGQGEAATDGNEATAPQPGDIVAVVQEAGHFTTLVKAIQAAGLIETLQGPGPFTVFAPTDEAFAVLPAGTLDALLADKAKLTAILTYHVVPGKLMASDVAGAKEAKTVQGDTLEIRAGDEVRVDDATVIETDIAASNGVIHVIDAVVLPN